MRKFSFNKLWRDKAPEDMEKDGSVVHVTQLNDTQYKKQLGLKLIEEASEVHTATSPDDLLSEIADVLEVIDCIVKFHNLSMSDVINQQEKKRNKRGSYLQRRFVTSAEYQPGSFGEKYSLKDLKRNPEILNDDKDLSK
jgi:predicted house-cleaning noncanonical NTP pyrophosphatase (MazG superfamily)